MTDHAPETSPPDIDQRSPEASENVRDDAGPLLGLELTTIENMGFNEPDESQVEGAAALSPLLGTSYSQSIENARGSSERRSPESVCYGKLLREVGPSSDVKSQKTAIARGRDCYGKLLRDLPKGVLRRGQKFYYRHTVPAHAQRLLNRSEIWRSLNTDSLVIASRRLPSVVARIEMEIEYARAKAGLPVDETLIQPIQDDPNGFGAKVVLTSTASVSKKPITLAEAYRSYIEDPTRGWAANTRQAYETSRKLAIAVIGGSVPISDISRIHCRDMLDVLRFLPANAAKIFPKLSPREAAERARHWSASAQIPVQAN